MSDIYKTARGSNLDLNRLKLLNEKTIAVGNSGTNARGDLVKGGRIVKTREQLTQESYNINANNVVKDAKIRHSAADVDPDPVGDPVPTINPYNSLKDGMDQTPVYIDQKNLENQPRGGLANAVNKANNINEVLDAQRKRI
jgi:hypothetical protein